MSDQNLLEEGNNLGQDNGEMIHVSGMLDRKSTRLNSSH